MTVEGTLSVKRFFEGGRQRFCINTRRKDSSGQVRKKRTLPGNENKRKMHSPRRENIGENDLTTELNKSPAAKDKEIKTKQKIFLVQKYYMCQNMD